MIVVVVEHWPDGDQEKAIPIASLGLTQVPVEEDDLLANFQIEMDEAPNPILGIPPLQRKTVVMGHNPRQSVWKLVKRAIDAVFPPLIT